MSEIWWAEVIRASHALGARSDAEFAAIARLLGLGGSGAHAGASATAQPVPVDPPAGPLAAPEPAGREEAARRARGTGGDRTGETTVVALAPVATEPFGTGLPAGPVLARPAPGRRIRVRPHLPLLAPRSTAAILQYLLGRQVPDGPVDVPAAIETLSAGRPLSELPREPRRTLRFGTQVLVDLGENLRPFRRDQVDVVAAVRALVGTATTDVRYFADAPLRGSGTGRRATWREYAPPAAGGTVLVLSDLGIGGDHLSLDRASVAEWVAFLRLVRRERCVPVALVPYPADRWPARLRALCPMLTWDRNVTVGHARAALR